MDIELWFLNTALKGLFIKITFKITLNYITNVFFLWIVLISSHLNENQYIPHKSLKKKKKVKLRTDKCESAIESFNIWDFH